MAQINVPAEVREAFRVIRNANLEQFAQLEGVLRLHFSELSNAMLSASGEEVFRCQGRAMQAAWLVQTLAECHLPPKQARPQPNNSPVPNGV